MYIVTAYDISDDKRRKKIDKLLSSYGFRVNYSVFELDISYQDYKKIIKKLQGFIQGTDSIRIYRIDKASVEKSIELNPKRSHPFAKEESYVF